MPQPDHGERRHEVSIQRKTEDLFVWEATVRFATTHDLPEGVLEQAVARAVRDSKEIVVERLVRVPNGGERQP